MSHGLSGPGKPGHVPLQTHPDAVAISPPLLALTVGTPHPHPPTTEMLLLTGLQNVFISLRLKAYNKSIPVHPCFYCDGLSAALFNVSELFWVLGGGGV